MHVRAVRCALLQCLQQTFDICSQHALAVMQFYQACACLCCRLKVVELMRTLYMSEVLLALVYGALAPNVSLLEPGMIRDEQKNNN